MKPIRVLVVDQTLFEALRYGAQGYLLKSVDWIVRGADTVTRS